MKYIKKLEFKDTLHIFSGEFGNKISILNDITNNEYVYEHNKFMFDIIDEKEIKIETEEYVKIAEPEIEEIIEEIIEDIIEDIEPIKEQIEEVEKEIERDLKKEIDDCESITELKLIAEENDISISARVTKIETYKEKLKVELNI